MQRQAFGVKLKDMNYVRREGVYGISFNSKNQVALVKVPSGYFLPGGGVDNNEDHISCLKREYKEETGYDIKIEEFVDCLTQYIYASQREKYLELVGYFYLVDLKEVVYEKSEMDYELVWKDVEEVKGLMNLEYQSWIINKVYATIIK